MPDTYRCRACGALYVDPLATGERAFHVCALVPDPPRPLAKPRPGHRDETWVQEQLGGAPHLRRPGMGRTLVALGDALSDATLAEIAALQAAPAIGPDPAPEPPIPWRADPAMIAGG